MPRPKGSKNKAPRKVKATETVVTDYAAQIAEKLFAKEAFSSEIANLNENLTTLQTDLKNKKVELKKLEKEIAKLEAKKAKADAIAAEQAKKAEVEEVVRKLLAEGVSAEEMLEKLKC